MLLECMVQIYLICFCGVSGLAEQCCGSGHVCSPQTERPRL